jgi:hypothetical protein
VRLIHLIDSREYVRSNCFQHQLLAHLKQQCRSYVDVTLDELASGRCISHGDVVLSTIRLRRLDAHRYIVAKAMPVNSRLWVYDQDPWESFVDSGTCRGAYDRIRAAVPTCAFIVTSRWWSDLVASRGIPCKFARMWPLPEYCDVGVPWTERPIRVGFKGTLHPHRRRSIERLAELGVQVTVLPSGSYQEFLADLSRMQFFFHDESGEPWTIDGKVVQRNCVWVKEIEAMARGCHAIRVIDDEAPAYCGGMPDAMHAVGSLEEVPAVIAEVLRDPDRAAKDSAAVVAATRDAPLGFRWIDLSKLAKEAS